MSSAASFIKAGESSFGMMIPGRTYEVTNKYRYGFNGKENDNEVKGEGNEQDYGKRIYDPRLGRFLSVDPINDEFPWNSPFSYAENDPVNSIDFDGLEKASPKALEYARYFSLYHRDAITRDRDLLTRTTDKKVIEMLNSEIAWHQKAYAALVKWRYVNRYQEEVMLLYHINEIMPFLEKSLDVTPAGDIKVLVSGTTFTGEERSRWEAAGWLVLDFFGGELMSGAGKAGRLLKTLKGPGTDVIEGVVKKVGNISKALDEIHLKAAINDILGKPVKIGGRVFDHLTEVKNALKGLTNQINKLNEVIGGGKATEEVVNAASDLRNTLQKQKDAISNIIRKAEQKAEKLNKKP